MGITEDLFKGWRVCHASRSFHREGHRVINRDSETQETRFVIEVMTFDSPQGKALLRQYRRYKWFKHVLPQRWVDDYTNPN